jgi:hypothetical protein
MVKETRIGKYSSVKVDLTGLNNLIKSAGSQYVVRVGILGEKPRSAKTSEESDKQKDPPTNAEIGLAHEKGVKSRNLTRRSWLQVPLEDHLPAVFIKEGPKAMTMMLLGQSLQAYEMLKEICEDIVQKGFDTSGYGKWKALELQTLYRKHPRGFSKWTKENNDQILVDTAQLRKSVTSVVVVK